MRTDDILDAICKHGDELALVLFSGIQYFTGQLFKIKEITQAAHKIVRNFLNFIKLNFKRVSLNVKKFHKDFS